MRGKPEKIQGQERIGQKRHLNLFRRFPNFLSGFDAFLNETQDKRRNKGFNYGCNEENRQDPAEVKYESLFKFSFDLGRSAYKGRKYLMSEPKPYACSQEDHGQLQYPMGEKGKQNEEHAFFLGCQVSDHSHNISIESDKKYRKNSQSQPEYQKKQAYKGIVKKDCEHYEKGAH
jgi:hypothetical protein